MSAPLPHATQQSLANARRAALVVLAACGLAVLATTSRTPTRFAGTLDSLLTTGVILLALGAIAARQIAASRIEARIRARCVLAVYGFAAALGIAGVFFALETGDALRGIGSVLGGFIFALAGVRTDGARRRGVL